MAWAVLVYYWSDTNAETYLQTPDNGILCLTCWLHCASDFEL